MKKWKIVLFVMLLVFSLSLAACSPKVPAVDESAAEIAALEADLAEAQAAAEAAAKAAADASAEELAAAQADADAAQAKLDAAQAELEAAQAAAAAAEAALAAIPVDIEMWALASVTEAGPPPDDWLGFKRIKEELNIDLSFSLIPPRADGEAKLNAAAAANDLPDVFMIVSTSNDRDNLKNYYDLGLLAPVEDMLDMMPQRKVTHLDPYASLQNLVTFDGHLYALPNPPGITNREGLVVRQDWLDNLGLEVPTTPAELIAVAEAFTFQDPDGNGKNDTYGYGAFIEGPGVGRRFNPIFGAYGVVDYWNFVDAEAGNFGLNVHDPEYYKAMQVMVELVSKGLVDPDWPTLTKDEFRARWKQGRNGIMWEDFAALTNKSNYTPFDDNFPEGSWTPCNALVGPGGENVYGLNEANFSIYAVSKKAADAGKLEAIARLFEWFATDGYYLTGFGEEGVNFNLDADGYINLDGIDPELAFNSQAMQPPTQIRGTAFYNTLAEISARYPNYETNTGRTMTPIQTYLKFYQSQQWIEGFAKKLIQPPTNAADLYRYYDEGILQFALGQKELTPATWAEFLAGLDALGAVEWEASPTETLVNAGAIPPQ